MLINAVIYFLLYLLVLSLWDSIKNRGEVARLVGGMRLRHLGWAFVTLSSALVALIALAVVAAFGPEWLRWSWFQALTGQQGTALSAGAGTPNTVPVYVLYAVYALMLLSMPFLVLGEERWFRRGAERRSWVANLGFAVLFGLAHVVVGFPVFAALALTAPAMVFTVVYRRAYRRHQDVVEATLESSRAHLAQNLLAFGSAALLLAAAS